MKFIRLTTPFFGCTRKMFGGLYITLIPSDLPGQQDQEVYIRWVYQDDSGNTLPGNYGDRLKGEDFTRFILSFQLNEVPALQFAIDNGLADGVIEDAAP